MRTTVLSIITLVAVFGCGKAPEASTPVAENRPQQTYQEALAVYRAELEEYRRINHRHMKRIGELALAATNDQEILKYAVSDQEELREALSEAESRGMILVQVKGRTFDIPGLKAEILKADKRVTKSQETCVLTKKMFEEAAKDAKTIESEARQAKRVIDAAIQRELLDPSHQGKQVDPADLKRAAEEARMEIEEITLEQSNATRMFKEARDGGK